MGEKVLQIVEKDDYLLLLPQHIEAKIVVGADGINSMVRKFMGLKMPKYGIAVAGILKEKMENIRIEVMRKVIPYGYSWVFPKKKECNIGVGSLKSIFLLKYLSSFQKRFPEVKIWKSGLVPLSYPIRSYGKNTILVGDAASQTISVVGAGNLSSMICAKIAAESLVKASRSNFEAKSMCLYEKMWKSYSYGN